MLFHVLVSCETHQLSFVSVWKTPKNASDYPQTRSFVPIKQASCIPWKDFPTPSLCKACGHILCVCTNCVALCRMLMWSSKSAQKAYSSFNKKTPSPHFVRSSISWNGKGWSNSMGFQGNYAWATLLPLLMSQELESMDVSLVLWNSLLEKILHSHRVWLGKETKILTRYFFFNYAVILQNSSRLLLFMWNHSLHGHFVGYWRKWMAYIWLSVLYN